MQNKKTILDILGPVMVGPSSSHTAGACRLGLIAGKIFGSVPNKVVFNLYNSFVKTGQGHGTQMALLAGILGFDVDSVEIKNSFEIAKCRNIQFEFNNFEDYNRHPNSVDFIMQNNEGETITVKGCSIGAGEILIEEINGFSFNFKGDYNTLLLMYKDAPGMIYRVANLIQAQNINIASMNCDRKAKGMGASMGICFDSKLPYSLFEKIKTIGGIYLIRYIERLKF